LSGPSESAVSAARAELSKLLGWPVASIPVSTIAIDVPKNKHGALIGTQATTLRQIEIQSGGCALTFPDRSSNSSLIQIEGSPAVIESAIAQVEKILGSSVKRVSGSAATATAVQSDSKSAPTNAAPAINTLGLNITTMNGVDLARIQVSKKVQHLLIGTKGATCKRIQDMCDVRLRIPG
jgi:hypothetical protein